MSSYSEGQIHQFADRLEAEGFTPGHITALGQHPRLADLKPWLDGEADIVLKPKVETVSAPEPYLRLISDGHKLTIPACSGGRTIARAGGVFRGYIDPDFVGYGLDDIEGAATPDTDVEVNELIRDGKAEDIYNSVGGDLDRFVLTQDQVISFVEIHRDWLRAGGYGTFFLLKKSNEFFFAYVDLSSDGKLYVNTYRLPSDYVWRSFYRLRFVLPTPTSASVAKGVAGK